jgi:predicted nucleic-acid-binding protein
MIGINTNILLRHALQDDPVQSPIATAFLLDPARRTEPALINPVMLLEFVWTLMRRRNLAKPDILAVLDVLIASPSIMFNDRSAVVAAIDIWRTGRADLPDYLIGQLNKIAGASKTVTFDRTAAIDPRFTLLPR